MKGTWLGISFDNHWVTLALVVYRRRQPLLRCLHQRPVLTHITETIEHALSSMGIRKFFGSVAVAVPSEQIESLQLQQKELNTVNNLSPSEITQLCQQVLDEHGYSDNEMWEWDLREQDGSWTLCAAPKETILFVNLALGNLSRSLKVVTTGEDLLCLEAQAEDLLTDRPAQTAQAVEAVALTLLGAGHEAH